jgi:hypothetical protein
MMQNWGAISMMVSSLLTPSEAHMTQRIAVTLRAMDRVNARDGVLRYSMHAAPIASAAM